MRAVLGSRSCIVCGQDNLTGLRLRFAVDEKGSSASWEARAPFEGFPGVIHGGIVLALLDDAMWYAALGSVGPTLTAEATVRYHRRLEIGMTVDVRGAVESRHGRICLCRAELCAEGGVIARANGKFLPVPEAERDRLVGAGLVHEIPAHQ